MTQIKKDYAHRVYDLLDKWNCLIEELQKAARHAGPRNEKPYTETIGQLITLREGARRGLLQVEDLEKPACHVKALWN
jgi:hypothetical protein